MHRQRSRASHCIFLLFYLFFDPVVHCSRVSFQEKIEKNASKKYKFAVADAPFLPGKLLLVFCKSTHVRVGHVVWIWMARAIPYFSDPSEFCQCRFYVNSWNSVRGGLWFSVFRFCGVVCAFSHSVGRNCVLQFQLLSYHQLHK